MMGRGCGLDMNIIKVRPKSVDHKEGLCARIV